MLPLGGRDLLSSRRLIALVAVVAAAVRVAHLLSFKSSPFYLLPPLDGEVYLATARHPPTGVYFQSPGYVAFLRAALHVSDGPLFFRVLQLGCGVATAALTTWIALELVRDRRFALVAGLGVALFGPLVAAEVWPALEGPDATMHAAACASLLAAGRSDARLRLGWLAAAGLALGGATLLRPSALLLLPAAALYAFVAVGGRLRARVGRAALPVGVALLCVAPVTLHNLTEGDFVLVTASGGLNLYLGNGEHAIGLYEIPPTLPGAGNAITMADVSTAVAEAARGRRLLPSEVSQYFVERTLHDVRARPAAWLRLMGKKLLLTLGGFEAPCSEDFYLERHEHATLRVPFVGFALLSPLFAVGVLAAFARDERRRARLLVAALAALTLSTTVLYFFLGRYRLPAIPFVAALAALGAETVVDTARARRWRALGGYGAAMALMLVVAELRLVGFNPAQEWVKLGTAAARLGRNDEAAAALEKALAFDPRRPNALHNLAVVRERQGRTDEARALWLRLRDAAAQDPRQRAAADAALLRLSPPR